MLLASNVSIRCQRICKTIESLFYRIPGKSEAFQIVSPRRSLLLTRIPHTMTANSNTAENRLTQVVKAGVTTAFTYDALGRRATKTVNGTTTKFLYDGADLLEETNTSGTIQARYLYGPGIDEPLELKRGTTTSSYSTDGLGSIVHLTTSAGAIAETYTYETFGKLTIKNASGTTLTTSALGNRFTFTGREWDSETGLYYYRARYYSPNTGRFLSRDPLGYLPDTSLYRYVVNNPTSFTDPFGLDYWIEGPTSGPEESEPPFHESVNVGDPNAEYDSYSFGVNGNENPIYGTEGEVYKDPYRGGKIRRGFYRKTTPEEDHLIKVYLESQISQRGPYRIFGHSCRNYSEEQFRRLSQQGFGQPLEPPIRVGHRRTSNKRSSAGSLSTTRPQHLKVLVTQLYQVISKLGGN